jgi:hypothetical protein
MRRAQSSVLRFARLACAASALALAGCSREKAQEPLTFERLPDTTGLSTGAAIVSRFEPSRMANGAVRVAGDVRLPDSTVLQIVIRARYGGASVAMAQVVVMGGRFDTPPLLGDHGPLDAGDYRCELLAHFDTDWQPARVLRETGNGLGLRGPGITRARNGAAALFLTRELHL